MSKKPTDADVLTLLDIVDTYFSEWGSGREAKACMRVVEAMGWEDLYSFYHLKKLVGDE